MEAVGADETELGLHPPPPAAGDVAEAAAKAMSAKAAAKAERKACYDKFVAGVKEVEDYSASFLDLVWRAVEEHSERLAAARLLQGADDDDDEAPASAPAPAAGAGNAAAATASKKRKARTSAKKSRSSAAADDDDEDFGEDQAVSLYSTGISMNLFQLYNF